MIKRGGERERIFLSVSLRREKEKRDNIAYLKEKKREVYRDWLTESIGGWMIAELFHPLHYIDEQSSTFSLAYIYSLWCMCLFSTVHTHTTVASLKILEIIKRSMKIIFFSLIQIYLFFNTFIIVCLWSII
jgi:hypothetical protein